MKQIILLFLSIFTISTYSQTYRNPNGNTVKVEVKKAPKTSADHIRDMQKNISNSFSQNSQNGSVAVKNKEMAMNGEGIIYKGNGIYTSQRTGKTDLSSYRRMAKKAREKIVSFCKGYKVNYEIINEEKQSITIGLGVARALITFRVLNLDGSVFISKEEAKKNLIELKKFLDLGIITKQEFDQKAINLKKALLRN